MIPLQLRTNFLNFEAKSEKHEHDTRFPLVSFSLYALVCTGARELCLRRFWQPRELA